MKRKEREGGQRIERGERMREREKGALSITKKDKDQTVLFPRPP
jgi:hypothetical protein